MERSESWFSQVLAALTAEGGALIGLQDRAGFVEMSDGTLAIVIWPSLQGDALVARLRELLQLDRTTHLKIALIGGDAAMIDVLRAAQPRFLARRMVQVFHLSDSGTVWGGRRSPLASPLGQVLARIGRGDGPANADRNVLAAGLPPSLDAQGVAAIAEQRAFVTSYRSRTPRATYVLLAVIAAVFGLELVFGGSEFVPTLVRMGANTEQSLHGEPWRLLASALLHGGVLHVAANGFVLWSLGSFVERILGPARLLILFVSAALCGSLASAMAQAALLSVGASGAIWGLLGVAGVLAFRPAGVLPPAVAGSLRRIAVLNLVINLAISFQPGIDLMAHLGGAAAGVLLTTSGLITRGVNPSRPETDRSRRASGGLTWFASVCGVVLMASLAWAWVSGAPWRLIGDPTYIERQLVHVDARASLPELLGEPRSIADSRAPQVLVGSALTDPLEVSVAVVPHPGGPLSGAQWNDPAWFYDVAAEVPEFAEREGMRQRIEGGPYPAFEEAYVYPNGLRAKVRYHLRKDAIVFVDVSYWPEAPAAWTGAPSRIQGSLRPL